MARCEVRRQLNRQRALDERREDRAPGVARRERELEIFPFATSKRARLRLVLHGRLAAGEVTLEVDVLLDLDGREPRTDERVLDVLHACFGLREVRAQPERRVAGVTFVARDLAGAV